MNFKWLTHLDVFPKVQEEIQSRSTLSGLVSVITSTLLAVLFLFEVWAYFSTTIKSEVRVAQSFNNTMNIVLDITFPSLACDNFGLDMLDATGDQHLEVSQNLKKMHTTKGQEHITKMLGCNLKTSIELNKVQGEFHIAFGRQAQAMPGQAGHFHQYSPQELHYFNCSHKFNKLSFGEDFPGAVHPLDNVQKTVTKGLGRFQYFIQIVPTIYQYSSGKSITSNQYSYTENTYIVESTSQGFKHPGLFFKYEFSPYQVIYNEQEKSLSHFITGCSALLGGIYVVSGMITSFIQRFQQTQSKLM